MQVFSKITTICRQDRVHAWCWTLIQAKKKIFFLYRLWWYFCFLKKCHGLPTVLFFLFLASFFTWILFLKGLWGVSASDQYQCIPSHDSHSNSVIWSNSSFTLKFASLVLWFCSFLWPLLLWFRISQQLCTALPHKRIISFYTPYCKSEMQ